MSGQMGDLGIFHGVMAAMPALDAQGFVVTLYVQFLPRVAGLSIVIASHQVQFDFQAIRSPLPK